MIQIDGDDVDAAWPRIDHVRGRIKAARDWWSDFPGSRYGPSCATRRQRPQIGLAVAVEIGRLDVGNPGPPVSQNGLNFPVAKARNQMTAPSW